MSNERLKEIVEMAISLLQNENVISRNSNEYREDLRDLFEMSNEEIEEMED